MSLRSIMISEAKSPDLTVTCTTPGPQEKAIAFLRSITTSEAVSSMLGGHRGTRPLLELLKNGTAKAQEAAAGVLANLCTNAQNKSIIVQSRGIPLLSGLLVSGSVGAKVSATLALRALSSQKTAADMLEAGVVERLVGLLKVRPLQTC